MAITFVVSGSTILGNKKMKYGTYSGNSTGGTLATGLNVIQSLTIMSASSADAAYATISGGNASVTVSASDSGIWAAIGL